MIGALARATRLRRVDDVIAADMNGETVMMRMDEGAYFALTGSGSHIWDALEETVTLEQLIDGVRVEFDTSEVEGFEDMVTEFVRDLLSKRLAVVVE